MVRVNLLTKKILYKESKYILGNDMKFKFFTSLLCIFLTSIFLFQPILSDVIEITIEYETTTTVPGATTTVEGGDGTGNGGNGDATTTIPAEDLVPGYSLTYSMPTSFDVYQDEIGTFTITIINQGTGTLNNIFIIVSGISEVSYSISPSNVATLESGISTQFSFSVNPEKITPDTYTLTFRIKSDETSETASLTLNVNEYTREVAEQIEEQEKQEQEIKKQSILKYLLIGSIVITCIVFIVYAIKKIKEAEIVEKPYPENLYETEVV